jgi:hypothetical protein
MRPTIGRIVHYTLSAENAQQINRRRTTGKLIAERIATGTWPLGAQAHIGNEAKEGQVLPMIVVSIPDPDDARFPVNGQVFLDGNDTFWTNSVCEGATAGTWSWPPRVES